MTRRGFPIVIIIIMTWALTAACTRSAPSVAPVVLPDLSSLAESVQRQIRERYTSLNQKLADAGASRADRAAAYGELGRVLTAAKFGDEAASCYLHAEELAPGDMRWPYYLGHVYLIKGGRGRAAAAFERASKLQPADVPTLVYLAETYLDDGRPDEAQSTFSRALSLQPRSAAAVFGAGRAALVRQAYPQAVDYFERSLAIDPRASAVHYPLATAYRALGQREKAEAHLRQRGDGWPDLEDPLRQDEDDVLDSPVAYEHRGVQALKNQDWAAAAGAFRKGLELAPADPTLRHWLGAALYAAGDVKGAESEFQIVVRRSPDFAKAHFSLGAIYDATDRHSAAIDEYAAAVKSDPTLVEARVRLAEALRASGQLQPSVSQYEEAIAFDPSAAEAWIGGAQALIGLRRYADARAWLARARRLHPDRPELAALETRLPAH